MKNRTTPDQINELAPNQVFVFGSNTEGRHGGGAAYFAHKHFGAEWGLAEGLSGQTYAIPTCDIMIDKVDIEVLSQSIDRFIGHACGTADTIYLVTPIGCGIAGFTPEEIAPLFLLAKQVENIHLPESFWQILN